MSCFAGELACLYRSIRPSPQHQHLRLPFLYGTRTISRRLVTSEGLNSFDKSKVYVDSRARTGHETSQHRSERNSESERSSVVAGIDELERQLAGPQSHPSFTRRPFAPRKNRRHTGRNDTDASAADTLPVRQASTSGEHYIDRRKKSRPWREPTDLSATITSEDEQEWRDDGRMFTESQGDRGSEENIQEKHKDGSTITPFELEAFGQLFKDLVKKSTKDPKGSDDETKESSSDKSTNLFVHQQDSNDELNSILQSILPKASTSSENPNLVYYPQALQPLAAQALDQIARSEADVDSSLEEDFIKDPVVKRRTDELRRVTSRLVESETDVELWKVLDEELFSKFRILDLDGIFKTQDNHVKGKGTPRGKRAGQQKADRDVLAKPDLTILAPNYPLHLLTALRRLTRCSQPPSSLVLRILPTVKALGKSSYILGMSTSLYNELLWHQWNNLQSLHGFMSTLQDMTKEGIAIDAQTHALIDAVIIWRAQAKRSTFGPDVAAFEHMSWRAEAGKELFRRKEQWRNSQGLGDRPY